MQRHLTTKTIVIVATILLCIYGIIGLPTSKAQLESNLQHNIRLGLDLKGGSHLVLQVQVQDAVRTIADHAIETLKTETAKQGIALASVPDRNDPQTIEQTDSIQINVHGVPQDKTRAFRSLVADRLPQWNLTPVNATDYKLNMKPSELRDAKTRAIDQSIQTIGNRVNALGLTEPVVQQRGRADSDYEILVQLPGVDDPARVKDIIGQAAQLEIVDVKEGPFPSQEVALQQKGGILPLNTRLVQTASSAQQGGAWYLVSRSPVIVGEDLRNARPSQDEFRKWEADFTLSQDGARRFEAFTGANIGNRLAVILDNQIRSVATIQSKISDSGRISNLGSQQEASDLALVMRSGSLPASIKYEEERVVGPSLGADSVKQGLIAGIAGLLAVIFVMLVYYKKSGINATLALVLNALILIACLSYFGGVLTLPGIAGIVLTIGMAVDSNVLIFERIREELRAGKGGHRRPSTAGFGKALLDHYRYARYDHCFVRHSCFLFGSGPG